MRVRVRGVFGGSVGGLVVEDVVKELGVSEVEGSEEEAGGLFEFFVEGGG